MEEETNQCSELMDLCTVESGEFESMRNEEFTVEECDLEMENSYFLGEESLFDQSIGLEIILQIFAHLNYVDLAACSKTCRAFYAYAFHPLLPQWRNLSLFAFRRTLNQDILHNILLRCTLIRSIDLKFCKLVKSTKKLEELISQDR